MTKEELQKLKEDLQKEQTTIEAELDRFAVKSPVIKGDYNAVFPKDDQIDTPDEMAHMVTDYENERAVEQNLEVRLKGIKDTIQRIDEGKYGICDKCSSQIELKRLAVMPVLAMCSDCAKKVKLL